MEMKIKKNKGKDEQKKKMATKSNRFLITINVFGSAGPIRFVVSGDDDAAAVIDTALKIYAREGRLPILSSDTHIFSLYPAHADFHQEMKACEKIGRGGERNFILSRREKKPHMTEARSEVINRKRRGWRIWLQKSETFKI